MLAVKIEFETCDLKVDAEQTSVKVNRRKVRVDGKKREGRFGLRDKGKTVEGEGHVDVASGSVIESKGRRLGGW